VGSHREAVRPDWPTKLPGDEFTCYPVDFHLYAANVTIDDGEGLARVEWPIESDWTQRPLQCWATFGYVVPEPGSKKGEYHEEARADFEYDPQDAPERDQKITGIEPYLRRLHHDAMQSGLLRTLDPRTQDPTLGGGHVTVDQVYTPLDTRALMARDQAGRVGWLPAPEDREEMREQETTLLSAMEAADLCERLVILGDPGSGKSTFVNFLALGLAGYLLEPGSDWLERLRVQGWGHGAPLPIYVTLRDFAQNMGDEGEHGTVQSLLGHIERMLGKYGCADAMAAVKDAMNQGHVLLMLDGLDEVPAENRVAVRDTVKAVMTAFPCRVLITCRILSYANPEWRIPESDVVTLAPFNQEKTQHFITAWYQASAALGKIEPGTAQNLIQDLTTAVDDPRLSDMATNPMLLTVMAIVHNFGSSALSVDQGGQSTRRQSKSK